MDREVQEELENLEDIIFGVSQRPHEVVQTGFAIDSDDKAGWAARKAVAAEERIREKERQAKLYHQKIDAWLSKATKRDEESVDYLRSLLKPYALEAISKLRKTKSIEYPGVTVSLRKLPDKLEISDEKLALAYCAKHLKSAVEVKKLLVKPALKAALDGGELIPGVSLVLGVNELYLTGENLAEVSHAA